MEKHTLLGVVDMNSNQTPKRYHIALLNSLRAIYMMGGAKLKVTAIAGQFSKTVFSDKLPFKSKFANYYIQRLDKMYTVQWKAQGDGYAKEVEEIIQQTEMDLIPDIFLKSLTIIKPYSRFDTTEMETKPDFAQFVFYPHPFKKGVFKRLKGRMPSQSLYKKMKEMRKRSDLDKETKKRWRDILLLNRPPQNLSNQEIINIWHNELAALILKESKGNFELMEIAELK